MNHDIFIARALAEKYHAGQAYGQETYMHHLEEVVDSVRQGSTDDRLIVVAWLHDILEDTDCPLPLLRSLFEDHVVDGVVAITKPNGMTKETYLHLVKQNQMARMVKLHDSLCNLRASVMRFDSRRIQKYAYQINYLAS